MRTLVTAAAFSAATLAAHAQTATDTPVRLDDIVVTASPVARAVATLPANVSVITADDIANRTALTLPDVLKQLAGVQVADQLGNGRITTVDIRGFGETAGLNTLVLVDGRRINAGDISGSDWTTIPLGRIERIEIVRGGGAVLYGDNAAGGVVNIITKTGVAAPVLSCETTVGSNKTFRQSVGLSGADGSLSYALNGNYADTDGHRINSYFRNRVAGLSLSYEGESAWSWDLDLGAKADEYGLPGSILKDGAIDRDDTGSPGDHAETQDHYIRFVPALAVGESGRLSLAMTYREMEQRSFFSAFAFVSQTRINDYGFSPKYSDKLELAGLTHSLTVGADFFASDRHDLNAFTTDDAHRHDAGYYAYDTVDLVADRLFLDLGYRHSRVDYHYDNFSNSTYGLDSARLGLTYAYAPDSKLFASFDRAYRTQLLDEFGGPWGAGLPLEPQISEHLQAGILHSFGPKLTAALTAFQIDTDNEIFFDPNLFQNTSYEKTRRQGLELELRSKPIDNLDLFFNFTWIDPRLKEGNYDGNEIPGVARQSAKAGATLALQENLFWEGSARWVKAHASIGDWGNTLDEHPEYVVVDTALRYTVKSVTLYAGINNLLDEEYEEYVTYGTNLFPAPEREFVAGIKYRREF